MNSLSWAFVKVVDPLVIAEELRELFRPQELIIDYEEGYKRAIDRLTEILERTGRREWMPLEVIKANSILYGPQYRFRLILGETSVKGFVTKSELFFIFGDTDEEDIVDTVRRTCRRIKGSALIPIPFG